MLNYIRRHAGNQGVKVLYIVLALTFLGGFGGIFGILRGCGAGLSEGTVAIVNRNAISRDDFARAYKNTINAYSREFNGQIPSDLAEKLNLPRRVLKDLIANEIAAQQAHTIGFIVTDQELRDQISHTPAFLNKDKKFDPRIYYAVLRENNITPDNFQQEVGNDLLNLKLRKLFFDNIFLSSGEIRILNTVNNTKLSLGYYKISPENMKPPAGVQPGTDYAMSVAGSYLKKTLQGRTKLPAAAGVQKGSTGPFTLQDGTIPGIGNAPDIAEQLLIMDRKGAVFNKVFTVGNDLFIVWTDSVKPAGSATQVDAQLRYDASQSAYNGWIQDLVSNAKIQTNQAILASFTQSTD